LHRRFEFYDRALGREGEARWSTRAEITAKLNASVAETLRLHREHVAEREELSVTPKAVDVIYNGSSLIATDTTAPYTYRWNMGVAGTRTLTAKATDNKGATRTSSAVTITVKKKR